MAFYLVVLLATSACGGPWQSERPGPAPGDSGPRIDAIIARQLLDIYESPARLPDGSRVRYNHPSMLCRTRAGTMIFMWNGGPSEGENLNRIFYSRKAAGSDTWSDPLQLENRQIDFGAIYQPQKPGSPVIAGYWLGPPPQSSVRMVFSHDDGQTWSEPMEFPQTDDPFWAGPPAESHYRFSMNPPIEFPDGTIWWASERFCNRSLAKAVPAVVVVPPDNYTGRNSGGKAWTSLHPPVFQEGRGYLGDFLILTPDYDSILYATRGGSSYLTEDCGKTWRRVANGPHAGGGAGLATLSLDVEGGPAQGWHIMAGTPHPGRNGMRLHITRTPTEPGSWRKVLTLHQDIPAEDADPSMIQTPDRKIHLLFTGRGENKLKYYILDPDTLVADKPPAKSSGTWPGQPINVKLQDTPEGIKITWTPAGNTDHFLIYRRRFEEGEVTELLARVDANTATYVDTRPHKRGRYGYWVQPVNSNAKGRWSKLAAITPQKRQ